MYKCVICGRKVDKGKASRKMQIEQVCVKCLKAYCITAKEVTSEDNAS